jgi:hypothetical protein
MDKVKMMWECLTPYKITHLKEYHQLLIVDKKDIVIVERFMAILNIMQEYDFKWVLDDTDSGLRRGTFVFSTKEKEMLDSLAEVYNNGAE